MHITTKFVISKLILGEVYTIQHYVIKFASGQYIQWFYHGTPVSSTNKTDRNAISSSDNKSVSHWIMFDYFFRV